MDGVPAKRRKVEHHNGDTAADTKFSGFGSAASAGLYRPNTFILETEELLKEARVDYGHVFEEADTLLHKIKNAIEGLSCHEAQPVWDTHIILGIEHD